MSGNQRAAPCAGACIKPVIRDGAAAGIKTTPPTGIFSLAWTKHQSEGESENEGSVHTIFSGVMMLFHDDE